MDNGTEITNQTNSRNYLIEKAVRKYSNLIFRLAYQNLGNYHDAEDILQEAAVALVRADAPLDDDAYLKNWLCRVTINKCKNMRKRVSRKNVEPLTEDIPAEPPEISWVMDELNKLTENYRNVLYLFYYEKFSVDEIADILGKSRNTVGSQLRRGRKQLEKLLKEGGYFDD